MKKILLSLILAISLLLSSCIIAPNDNTDKNNDISSIVTSPDNNGGADIDDECPGSPGDNSGGNSGADGDNNTDNGNTETLTHKDDDDNGFCDRCEISVIVEVNFFVLNDFHGKMSDSDTQPGVDELSLYLKNMKATHKNPILLASGDMWQGGAESNLTRGLLVTEWMNELDFAAMTLGNHEFDWGEDYIEKNSDAAEFPLLAINVYNSDTNALAEYCAPSVTVDLGEVQIGIIGAIGDCYSSISSDMVTNVYFKTGTALTSLVKAEADRLRADGVDYIVYSIHDGYYTSSSGSTISDESLSDYYDTTLSSGGYVDVVFEAHSHKTYALYDNYGVYHLQGGGDNAGFVHFTAEINSANGNDKSKSASIIRNYTYANLDTDPYIDELFEKYAEEIAKAGEILGNNAYYKSSTALKKLVAKLYLEIGEANFGEDYDIVLGGGFLQTRSPYDLEAGQVTYSDLMMLFPFDNDLMLCSVSGYNLRRKFIETTNSNYYVAYSTYGASVKDNIDDNATYYILVDSYTAQYKPNKLTVVKRYTSGIYARDLLADYIKRGGME